MTLATQNLEAFYHLQNTVYALQTQAILEGLVSSQLIEKGRELDQRRTAEDGWIRDRLLKTRRIVGGARTYDALVSLDAPVLSPVPAWAKPFRVTRLEGGSAVPPSSLRPDGRALIGRGPSADVRIDERKVSRRHAEIIFHHGWHWIRDLGSYLGTFVNGRRLARDEWIPLTLGAMVFTGEDIQIEFAPRPELDVLAPQIAGLPTIEALSAFLKARGVPLAKRVAEGAVNLPDVGGLPLKVYSLRLERDFRRVKEKYLPNISDALALDLLNRTAEAVAAAKTKAELVAALRSSLVPNLGRWALEAERYFRGGLLPLLREFPEEMGIRAKVEELSRRK